MLWPTWVCNESLLNSCQLQTESPTRIRRDGFRKQFHSGFTRETATASINRDFIENKENSSNDLQQTSNNDVESTKRNDSAIHSSRSSTTTSPVNGASVTVGIRYHLWRSEFQLEFSFALNKSKWRREFSSLQGKLESNFKWRLESQFQSTSSTQCLFAFGVLAR